MKILGYVADASIYCTHCACKRYGDVEEALDREGNHITALYDSNHEGFAACDDCGDIIEDEYFGDHDRDLVIELARHLGSDIRESVTYLEEKYAGAYTSIEEWAQELLIDTGSITVNDRLYPYFDYAAYARDCELGGDIFTIVQDNTVHVFWN